MPPRLCQRSPANPWRGPMDTLCWWFVKLKRGRCRHRPWRPQRYPHRKILSLRLQNVQQPSRIRSHPRQLIPRSRSWCQISHVQNWFQAYRGSTKWRVLDQRPYPPIILSPGRDNHPIRLWTSLHPTHSQIQKCQSWHIIQTSQHQAKKPPPITITANAIRSFHHKHLSYPNPTPSRQLDNSLHLIPPNR